VPTVAQPELMVFALCGLAEGLAAGAGFHLKKSKSST